MAKRVVLFTLHTFSNTGGLQKMTRTLGYSLYQLAKANKWNYRLWSLCDSDQDLMAQYLPAENFRGFKYNRPAFMLHCIKNALFPNLIIISHINMAIIGLIIKAINPKCKVWLIAHGIEVWRPVSFLQRLFLKRCDKILCVSNFTREQMIKWHKVDPNLCEVLNNAIDPFMHLPQALTKPAHLLSRYQLTVDAPIIFTLTRLASTEQYKGHEQVIKAVSSLKLQFKGIKYILSGQYDPVEEIRIKKLIADYGVQDQVLLTGFIDEAELSDHFLLADLFVLPSKKEGFGIVFIEALACGLPVICGNADGSIDAICNGLLGKAIDADNLNELEEAMAHSLNNPLPQSGRRFLQQQCLAHFNEDDYRTKLKHLIDNG